MYTELEKYMAIRKILGDYQSTQLADYEDYIRILKSQAELTTIDNQKAVKSIAECALDLEAAALEYFYSTKVIESMDKIFRSVVLPQKTLEQEQRVEEQICKKLEKHETDTAYSYMISNLAYEIYDDTFFTFSIAESIDPLVLSNQTKAIFSYEDMDRETKIYYDVLQLALAKSRKFQELVKPKEYTR